MCSFSADTLVLTQDGLKPILEIEPGDEVIGYVEATGETGSFPVTDTIHHTDPEIVLLTIDDEVLETTAEHPFYTDEGVWVNASDLEVGEQIRNFSGEYGMVESVEIVSVTQPMYNLTVDEAHTFFVGEGEWLVHNVCEIAAKANLKKGVDYPIDLRGMNLDRAGRKNLMQQAKHRHNQEANRQLYELMEQNPEIKNFYMSNYPEIVEGVQPLPRGGFARRSPPGWEWHHETHQEGVLSLMRFKDHKRLKAKLHLPPKGRGGMEIWGVLE